jgi:hypothetical protein
VDDFLDHTADVSMAFTKVELAEGGWILVQTSMGCEYGTSSLPG